MNEKSVKIITLLGASVAFYLLWMLAISHRELPAFAAPGKLGTAVETTALRKAPSMTTYRVSNNQTLEAHSASIVNIDEVPVAVWYGGSEEGHRDVAIFAASFSKDEGWSPPTIVTNRAHSEANLNRYIRKVGNPALHAWPDGRLGLFYVTVSFGGWAAASINYMESLDRGQTWNTPKRIVTSPFLNISTLVRTEGHNLSGGGLKLPAYHEFLGKFAEVLQFDTNLTLQDKSRISRGKHSLQPAIAPLDDLTALALLRYAGDPPGRVLSAKSYDAGKHWTHPVATDLPNPNSAVAVTALPNGAQVMALNDLEDDRYRLSLAVLRCERWQLLRKVEESTQPEAGEEFEYSYPSMTVTADGFVHLVYTWNQQWIKHVRFNVPWLMAGDEYGQSLAECEQDSV